MKSKFLQVRKMLLVAAGLLVGASAWAEDEVYNFENFIGGCTQNHGLATGATTSFTVGGETMVMVEDFTTSNYNTQRYSDREFSANSRFAVSSTGNWQMRRSNNNYLLRPQVADKGYFSVLNLNEGDKLVFNLCSGDGADATTDAEIIFVSTNAKVEGESENVEVGAKLIHGTTYVMTADGRLDINITQWQGFKKIVITPNPDVETVSVPNIDAIAANGGERIVELSGGSTTKEGASIASYKYTIDGTEPSATDGLLYDSDSKIVISATTTVKAVAISSTGKASAIASKEISAGTTLSLNAPVLTLTSMSEDSDGFYYPVYQITDNNASVIGNPAAVSYKTVFTPADGGADVEGTVAVGGSYTFTAAGTVKVISVAPAGYNNSAESTETKGKYLIKVGLDFSDASIARGTAWDNGTANRTFNDSWPAETKNTRYNASGDDATLMFENLTSDTAPSAVSYYLVSGFAFGHDGANSHNGVNLSITTSAENDITIWTTLNTSLVETPNVTIGTASFRLYKFVSSSFTALKSVFCYTPAPQSVSATIGATNYTTFASNYALDLAALPDGVKAYSVSGIDTNGTSIVLKEETGAVEAGTGLILEGTANESYDIPVAASGSKIDGNKLVGCPNGKENVQGEGLYVLVNNDGTAEFQQLDVYPANIPAGKAYLDMAGAAGARTLSIVIGGETTGIAEVATAGAENGAVYNLSGQRISKPANGLYIVNGKKVIIK